MYYPGGTGRHNIPEKAGEEWWNENDHFTRQSLNDIEMYNIGDSLESFYKRDNENFRLHFSWEDYKLGEILQRRLTWWESVSSLQSLRTGLRRMDPKREVRHCPEPSAAATSVVLPSGCGTLLEMPTQKTRSLLLVPHSLVRRLCEVRRVQDSKRHSHGVGQ